jgi:hypothetical protein
MFVLFTACTQGAPAASLGAAYPDSSTPPRDAATAGAELSTAEYTLDERDFLTSIQPILEQSGKAMTMKCLEGPTTRPGSGGAITFALDTGTLRGHVVQNKAHSEVENDDTLQGTLLSKCQAAEYVVKNLCDTEEGKKAVKAKIQKVVCAHGDSAPSSISLSGGTLRVVVNATKNKYPSEVETLARGYLQKNL